MKVKSQLIAIALSAMTLLALPPADAYTAPAGIADGAGIWVNLWHYPEGNLDTYCSQLRAHGIRNLFLQTSRSNTEAIRDRQKLGEVIEACHRHNIRVIAWSFATLVDPVADADKMVEAARFLSPAGESIDAVAPNLETHLEAWRVEKYSQHLRKSLGKHYPMIAVVFSPLNRAPQVAATPWKVLAEYYDVIAPMAYWSGKHQKLSAHEYTLATVQKVRQLCGRSNVEVHVIGDGMGTGARDIHQFLLACKAAEATSASLYPNHRPTAEQMVALSRYADHFPTNARFRLAAFKALTESGALPQPPEHNPSRALARGEFYRLVVRQLLPRSVWRLSEESPPGDISSADALKTLIENGLVGELPAWAQPAAALGGEISSRDALSLIAGTIELNAHLSGGSRARSREAAKRRLDRWFAVPAMAQPEPAVEKTSRPVNYLDAAQMVLEARAGLR